MLVAGVAVAAGRWTPDPSMAWIGSWPALVAFGSATVLEIAGYYVPWVDNLLDTIATPAAAIAGALATATFITGMDPMSQWALAIIAGGGTAATVQTLTVATRAASSLTTGGVANPVVSTVEAGASTTLAIVAILIPALAAALVLAMFVMLVRFYLRRRAAKQAANAAMPA